jgi:hypothetical protein
VSPGKHDVIKPTVRFVDAIFSRVDTILGIGVCSESIGVDNLVGELATDDYAATDTVRMCGKGGGSFKYQMCPESAMSVKHR